MYQSWERMVGDEGELIVKYELDKLSALGIKYYQNLCFISPGWNCSTEIDFVVVSPHKIFVLEVKHWFGAILGRPSDDLKFTICQGKDRSIKPNPFIQNQKHLEALSKKLGVSTMRMQSLVLFTGKCELCEYIRLDKRTCTNFDVLASTAPQNGLKFEEFNRINEQLAEMHSRSNGVRSRHAQRVKLYKKS